MKVNITRDGTVFHFTLELHPDDPGTGIAQGGKHVSLMGAAFRFDLPEVIDDPHPDLLAAAILTVVQPFVGAKIAFSRPVSQALASVVKRDFLIEAGPVDPSLEPRRPGKRDCLSFSGGTDSLAASLLLPENTVHLFLERMDHPAVPNPVKHYSAEAALRLVEEIPHAYAARTDCEFLCGPTPGFATWPALSAQCLLMADHFNFKNVSYGTIQGSAYIPNGHYYREINGEYSKRWERMLWGSFEGLFKTVGLPISKPVAGLTEIGTAMLVENSRYAGLSSSCVKGRGLKPCMRCQKCLRTTLTASAVKGERIPVEVWKTFAGQKDVQVYLTEIPPVYFQHIYMYTLSRLEMPEIAEFKRLRDLIFPVEFSTDWCEKWFPQSAELIFPEEDRPAVIEKITSSLAPMTVEEQEKFRQWNLFPFYLFPHNIYSREYSRVQRSKVFRLAGRISGFLERHRFIRKILLFGSGAISALWHVFTRKKTG